MEQIIKATAGKISNEQLRRDVLVSLKRLAARVYRTLLLKIGTNAALATFVRELYRQDGNGRQLVHSSIAWRGGEINAPNATTFGLANENYIKVYTREARDILLETAQFKALDPDDLSGRNSLRNKAEMIARNDYHFEQEQQLRQRGVKLVVCSVHQDCSERCFPWQGKVYSLDHSYGVTPDGKYKYQPLEVATDHFYTTKAGKRWKNGLLGFNCRHSLREYIPNMIIPKVSAATQKRDYAVTKKQRDFEERIRQAKANAAALKGIDPKRSTKERKKATALYRQYKAFSARSGRAYFPDRVKII